MFARLADSLDPRHDVIDTMDLLVHSAVNFTSAIECGVVLADAEGVLHVVASTSERTSDVEEAELGTEQGPCLDSFRSGQVVETPDVSAAEERWPIFVRVAEEREFCAGYAVPLLLRGQHLGAMNLFFDRTDAVTDRDAAISQALAEFATIGIVQRRALQHHADRAAQLQHALDSRVVIERRRACSRSSAASPSTRRSGCCVSTPAIPVPSSMMWLSASCTTVSPSDFGRCCHLAPATGRGRRCAERTLEFNPVPVS